MTPGLARCFGYKRGTPSGTEVGMRPDQAPSAIACSVDTDWPRHAGSKAPLHARRLPIWPARMDATSRHGFGHPRLANFPGTAAR